MMALLLTVLVASLVGSLHCAGMCGAFVAFAVGAGDPAVKVSRTVLLGMYQVGRLVTYLTLGVVAGVVGAGVDLGGRMVGMQRMAAVAAGGLMVGFGLVTLLRQIGWHLGRPWAPAILVKVASAGNRGAARLSPVMRAGVTGLLTTLLPCGWLYTFVILAAGTGSGWLGAAVMGMFWVGTLPVLSVVGLGVRKLAGPVAAKLPVLTAGAIVAVGLYTIVARAQIVLPPIPPRAGAARPADLVEQVKGIDQSKLPCCTAPGDDKVTR